MKTYSAPELVEYGDIATLTARSFDSLAQDFEFSQSGNVINTGQGSMNSCVFRNDEGRCINTGG